MSGSYLAVRLQLEDDIRHDRELTPFTREVGVELAKRRSERTGQLNISIAAIARVLHCSPRTVDRALSALVEAGWIVRMSGRGRSSNSYAIPRLDHPLSQQASPGASEEPSSRQNDATTEGSSRQNDATSDPGADPLSRHFVSVVAPFCHSLLRQNVAQSPLGISLTISTPQPPAAEIGSVPAGGGGNSAPPPGEPPAEAAETATLWADFVRTYPADPLDASRPAEQAFRALPIEDQRAAVRHLPAYLASWAARKRAGRHVGRKRWLEERRWTGFVDAERRVGSSTPDRCPDDDPADPLLKFPTGFSRRQSFVRDAVARFAENRRSWPAMLGPPPGEPGCCVPGDVLARAPALAESGAS